MSDLTLFTIRCILAVTCIALQGCTQTSMPAPDTQIEDPDTLNQQILITIGPRSFTATLYHNATAAAFKALLPVTLEMSELNGNEKFVRLPASLPENASNPGTIQNGDLMLYGPNTLVLFYQSFPTSYSYTRIGRIDDTTRLAGAVGSGNVTVTFQAK